MPHPIHNRTSLDDPTQGTAFHELLVLPTLAPHLARPYRVPGTDTVYNMEFAHNTQGMLHQLIAHAMLTIHDVASTVGDDPDITETPAPVVAESSSQEDHSSELGPEQPIPAVGGNLNLRML
jgi:hypothetical protein